MVPVLNRHRYLIAYQVLLYSFHQNVDKELDIYSNSKSVRGQK